jgi:hypothetical protein
MDGMIVGDRDEKQKEQIQFATNEIFCHSIAVSKNAAIKQDGKTLRETVPMIEDSGIDRMKNELKNIEETKLREENHAKIVTMTKVLTLLFAKPTGW